MDLDSKLGLIGMLIVTAIGIVLMIHGIEGRIAPLMPQSTHPLIHL